MQWVNPLHNKYFQVDKKEFAVLVPRILANHFCRLKWRYVFINNKESHVNSLKSGVVGLVMYPCIIAIFIYISADQVADLIYAIFGGAIASLFILLKDIEIQLNYSKAIKNFFRAIGFSIVSWLVAFLILKLFNVWVNGSTAAVFDLTIGAFGSIVMYLFILENQQKTSVDI